VPLSIRARLTLWYTAVLLAVLLALGAGLYAANTRLRLAQLDAELARGCAAVATVVAREMDEEGDLRSAARETQQDLPAAGRAFAIYDGAGTALTNDTAAPNLLALAGDPRRGRGVSRSVPAPDGRRRVYAQSYEHGGQVFSVAAAESLAAVEREQALLGRTLVVAIPVALLLAGAGGWLIAQRALRPVGLMAWQSGRISDRTPGFRLSVSNPHDELGRLAAAFNGLLDRLEGALHAQRRFMADASHELRTPVSIIRTAADVTLARERSAEEYRDALALVADHTRRLARMVEDMLTLARGDAGALKAEATDFYFDELVAECVRDAMVLAAERRIDVRRHGREEVPFRGDEALLRRMLLNLLDNAVRHTPPGGSVDVGLEVAGSSLAVEVADTGGGIPGADGERIFERFVRLDPARGPDGGAGLGLAIARSIAEAHGGTLVLARSDASGSRFLVRLPCGNGLPDPRAPL
jgi:heavy metal sensor kinase